MSVIIEGFDKPKNCYSCPFNNSDYYCNLTKGLIDRDDWTCSVTCPIKDLNSVLSKIRAEINGMYRVILRDTPKDDWAVRWNDCIDEVLQIIDKHKGESEE